MHALSRIMLHGAIDSIQCSWVKLGDDLCRDVLNGGVNDLGGTLMEETISRMAGADNGSYKTITDLRSIVAPLGRPLRQRTTLYGTPAADRIAAAEASDGVCTSVRQGCPSWPANGTRRALAVEWLRAANRRTSLFDTRRAADSMRLGHTQPPCAVYVAFPSRGLYENSPKPKSTEVTPRVAASSISEYHSIVPGEKREYSWLYAIPHGARILPRLKTKDDRNWFRCRRRVHW